MALEDREARFLPLDLNGMHLRDGGGSKGRRRGGRLGSRGRHKRAPPRRVPLRFSGRRLFRRSSTRHCT
eukprot:4962158-Lingulodinium_polyedra.AAC.1